MANSCSICQTQDGAQIVNEMLHAKKLTLLQIAEATGHSKSSVHRHSRGSCPRGYQAFRAALVRNKGKLTSGDDRLVVQWPDSTPADVKPNSVVLVVEYRKTKLEDFGNPEALVCSAFDEAIAEDLERSKLSGCEL